MREIITRFNQGIPVSANEFKNGGLDFYLDVVDPMINQEKAVEYPDFFGNVWARRVNPIIDLTPEQEHLIRPTPDELRKKVI